MSTLLVEGFSHYGTDEGSGPGRTNMLSGKWAELSSALRVNTPSWADETEGYWMSVASGLTGARIVIPTAGDVIFVAMSFAVSALPGGDSRRYIASFRNASNGERARLYCQASGALELTNASNTSLGRTVGPVIAAQTRYHLEMKINVTANTFSLRVNGVVQLNLSSLTFSSSGDIGQLMFFTDVSGLSSEIQYMKDLIVFDDAGTRNNDFAGDRRVATLFVNSDGAAQGWTERPRYKIGNGILDNTANTNSCVTLASSVTTDLGNGDYTIETFVRFKTLPTGSNKAHIFGKWDETNNSRSYQLYKAGPSLDNGDLVFRTSTDGLAGTVANKLSWPWEPEKDIWYHVAVVRESSDLYLFIDGVQRGLPVTDAGTYYAGASLTSIGGQTSGTSGVSNTAAQAFFDEVRLTAGVARYTANFTPTVVAFGRTVGTDADFASVELLCGFDSSVADESSNAHVLTARNGAAQITPGDGDAAYETINNPTPIDDTFVEAALTPATQVLTVTALPSNTETVTVGTKAGPSAAVYTWKTSLAAAFDVLIGANVEASLTNLAHAINDDSGEGTLYGTGTTINLDVTATVLPNGQMQVTASTPGTAGNSIASTETMANGSWGDTTLNDGADIPTHSEFGFQRPPRFTTVIKSVTLATRNYKTDSGTCKMEVSFVGPGGAAIAGTEFTLSTNASYHEDTFEVDPDTSGDLSPSTIVGGKIRLDRTE